MAQVLIRQFESAQLQGENPMPLAQIREAAIASEFPDRESLQRWLEAALGDNLAYLRSARRHAQMAVALCPLQGEAYVHLADLMFLDNLGKYAEPLVAQALKTRPYEGAVLLAAGGQFAFRGQEQRAIELWREAFHLDAAVRQHLIITLAPQAPAELILAQFQPDVDGLEKLYWQYVNLGLNEQAAIVGAAYAGTLADLAAGQTGREASQTFLRLASLYHRQGEVDLATRACREALKRDPSSFAAHRVMARLCSDQGLWPEAAKHLRWCAHRQPQDQQLNAQLKAVLAAANSGDLR